MNNNVVEKSELELRRNLGEAKTYIDNILTKVKSLSDEVTDIGYQKVTIKNLKKNMSRYLTI